MRLFKSDFDCVLGVVAYGELSLNPGADKYFAKTDSFAVYFNHFQLLRFELHHNFVSFSSVSGLTLDDTEKKLF